MKTRLLILLALVVATAAGADNSPVIWKGSNAKDLSSGGLETNKLVLPKAAGSAVKVTLQPSGSTSSSFALTLPVDDGAANECLKTDGSGALAWTKIADANVASGAAIDATKIGGGGVTTTEFGYIGGLTSDAQTQLDGKQPLDSDLTAVAGLSSTGIVARTGSGTAAVRTITANSSKIAIANGDGVSGNPTVDVTEANLTLDNIGGTLSGSKGGTGVSSTATFPATSTSTTSSFALLPAANTFTAAQTISNTTDASSSSAGGALTVSGGAAVAKKLYVGTGTIYPNSGASSLTGSTHNYYAERNDLTCTFTWDGTGSPGNTGSKTLKVVRNGAVVTLYVPSITATTGTSSAVLGGDTALPSWARPGNTVAFATQSRDNASNSNSIIGLFQIDTSGNLSFQRAGGSTFTNTASAGMPNNHAFTYLAL